MLQATMPPVSYGCKVVLRTICWILASRLTPLRKNDKVVSVTHWILASRLTPLRKNDRERACAAAQA
jgi:hypothetical protein